MTQGSIWGLFHLLSQDLWRNLCGFLRWFSPWGTCPNFIGDVACVARSLDGSNFALPSTDWVQSLSCVDLPKMVGWTPASANPRIDFSSQWTICTHEVFNVILHSWCYFGIVGLYGCTLLPCVLREAKGSKRLKWSLCWHPDPHRGVGPNRGAAGNHPAKKNQKAWGS